MAIVVEKGKNRYIFTDTTNLEDTLEFARSCGGEYRKNANAGGDIKNFARARDLFELADACEEALCMLQSTAHKGANTNLSSMEYYDGLLQEVAYAAESTKKLFEDISGMLLEHPELFEHRNPDALSRIRFELSFPKTNEKHRAWEREKCFHLKLDFNELMDERILMLRKELEGLREANQQLEKSKAYLLKELELKKSRLAEDHEPYRLLDAVIQARTLKKLVASLISYFQIQNEEWALLVEFLNEPIFRESRWATYFYQKKEETEKQISNIKNLLNMYEV